MNSGKYLEDNQTILFQYVSIHTYLIHWRTQYYYMYYYYYYYTSYPSPAHVIICTCTLYDS